MRGKNLAKPTNNKTKKIMQTKKHFSVQRRECEAVVLESSRQ